MFSKFKPFVLNFNSFGRFPHVLFLKPQESPLIGSMFQELRDIFPEVKPYGGRISNFVPHVTLAQHPNETYLDIVQEKHGQHVLGLQEHINHVQLHVIRDKKWELLRTFSF
jgi:2'-5' RNA ligase